MISLPDDLLAELSAGPQVARTARERVVRQAHLQPAESDFEAIAVGPAAARSIPVISRESRGSIFAQCPIRIRDSFSVTVNGRIETIPRPRTLVLRDGYDRSHDSYRSREPRNDTLGVLRRAPAGEPIEITVNGEAVARLAPLTRESRREWARSPHPRRSSADSHQRASCPGLNEVGHHGRRDLYLMARRRKRLPVTGNIRFDIILSIDQV